METRDKTIIKTSIIGIIVNIFLSVFKAVVGMLSNSIAIILDAVNNLSDALSSVITIVGTKLASKKPDRKHPLGHGRIEYLSAMLVAAIILYANWLSGYQGALMVPTEILAEQHYKTLAPLLEGLGVRCALLTAATTATIPREIPRIIRTFPLMDIFRV